jgi:hypothetical protein
MENEDINTSDESIETNAGESETVVGNSSSADKILSNVQNQKKAEKIEKKSLTQKETPVDWQKRYTDLQSYNDKSKKEYETQLKRYEYLKQYEPALAQYNKQLEIEKQQELAQKYQQDPISMAREIARQEAEQLYGPYRDLAVKQEANEIVNEFKTNIGEEKYVKYEPVMMNIMSNLVEADKKDGTSYASEVARNPQLLYYWARGVEADGNEKIAMQQNSEAQTRRQNQLHSATGVGRSKVAPKSVDSNPFDGMNSSQMRIEMKKMGLIK